MAMPAKNVGLMTHEEMNSGQSYRVRFSYGTFTIAPTEIEYADYYYAYKKHRGKLYKVYVGKCGWIDQDTLHRATMRLSNKLAAARIKHLEQAKSKSP